jgi:serine/threonine protein phosphatase PrpC
MEIDWISQRGKRTGDNRDCAGVGMRARAVLCVVLDGWTSGPNSAQLAHQITRGLVDWFITADEAEAAERLIGQLRRIHQSLSREFPMDGASYVIACLADTRRVLILHAGDCLLGSQAGCGPVQWIIRPHTLANAGNEMSVDAIALSHARHRLTRSFRAREFMRPDVAEIRPDPNGSLIAATDGFWAELTADEQVMFLRKHKLPMGENGDDRSVLQIRDLGGKPDAKMISDRNALVARFS